MRILLSLLVLVLSMNVFGSAVKGPSVELTFNYFMVNDVEATKHFYGDLLGMKVDAYAEGGYVGINAGHVSLLFFKADSEIAKQKGWAWQPGDGNSENVEVDSFSLKYIEKEFKELYQRLKEAPQLLKNSKPDWRQKSYWGLTVRDPMGKTIEIYYSPKDKPVSEKPVWEN